MVSPPGNLGKCLELGKLSQNRGGIGSLTAGLFKVTISFFLAPSYFTDVIGYYVKDSWLLNMWLIIGIVCRFSCSVRVCMFAGVHMGVEDRGSTSAVVSLQPLFTLLFETGSLMEPGAR